MPNRSSTSLLLVVGFLSCLQESHTQAAQPGTPAASAAPAAPVEAPPLSGPPLKRPALPAAWKITTQALAPGGSSLTPYSPVSVSVLYTKTTSHETTQLKNGDSKDLWLAGGFAFLCPTGSDTVKLTEDAIGTAGTGPTLDEFAWVGQANYRGQIDLNGESHLIFVIGNDPDPVPLPASAGAAGKGQAAAAKASGPKWPAGPIAGLPLKPGIMVAAITERTRLPKFLQRGSDISQYEFSTPDAQAVQVPLKVQQAIKHYTPKPIMPLSTP